MTTGKKSYIFLTGGLGNQLFQLAFLQTRVSDIKIAEITLGNPRLNTNGIPDICDFQFSDSVQFRTLNGKSTATRKLPGYFLRLGLKTHNRPMSSLLHSALQILGNLLLSVKLRDRVKIVYSRDNGFNYLPESKANEYLVGYFQSYKWVQEDESLNDLFRSIRLKNPSDDFRTFLNSVRNKKTLAVHVRLGDYFNDPTLGILHKSYYQRAISEMIESDTFDEIWLFSNEPEHAMEFIPDFCKQSVKIVPNFSGSASETLEAMRHASAYVIANSSLSWWGAALSYSLNPKVIAPKPWFAGKPEPRDLIPNSWKQIKVLVD